MSMIAVVGDSFVDVVVSGVTELPREWGQDQPISGVALSLGGSALNCAASIANLGTRAHFISAGINTFSDSFIPPSALCYIIIIRLSINNYIVMSL